MGMDRTVSFAGRPTPAWAAVADLLARHGFPVQVRMIDGQLAFPDEQPPPSWQELRVGLPQGMVTLRRQGDDWVLVTWGNADAGLLRARNALAWALAEATGGGIHTPSGPLSAADFLRTADLPAATSGNG